MAILSNEGPLRLDTFRSLAVRRLHPAPQITTHEAGSVPPPSDFDLNPSAFADWSGNAAARPAAVLVPIVARDDLCVLLTQRTPHLAAHAGQISFPGGKPDPLDTGPVDTALREAEEEIGLARTFVEPIGFLDVYRTGTGFAVTPVVALVHPGFVVVPNANEVAAVFEVPLAFLMDPANHRIDAHTLGGRDRRFYAMPFGERYIWGATAGILRNMHDKLFGSP
jgi:8-oxo-dGTP pyrophosphatase MutT (NUDIX family)